MSSHGISDEELLKSVAALNEAGGNQSAAARSLNMNRLTFRDRLASAARRGLLGTKPVLPGFEIARTTVTKNAAGEVERETVEQRPERGAPVEVPPGFAIDRLSILGDGEGREVLRWTKLKADGGPGLVEAITAAFADVKPCPMIAAPKTADRDLLSVYPIADQHLGLLAWGAECGESYDLKIAAERLRSCARRLIAQSPASARALILNLGDWTHNDDFRNRTPASGHILDVDGRYPKVVETGVRLMREVIELALQKHKTVLVKNLPGNHDPNAIVALNVALKLFYENNPRVTIEDGQGEFFFHRFGETLIGAHHGHKAKAADLAMAMAVRCREAWGSTKWHVFYTGHIHHETAREVGDVRCESFQTLAAKDAYAAGGAYSSGQSLTSITLHADEGEVGRHRVNLPPVLTKVAA